ncbi:flagellar biosynthesis regulator FlaF [Shimia biformata]|uniref:flagellar biosynthesis regulator FlaF n=1 Tax=Shimia biformata TaxID=1294299 RepID=UPI00194E08C3
MTYPALKSNPYAAAATHTATPRSLEYQVIARVTRQLRQSSESANFSALATAVHDNRRLWNLLATDVADAANSLPQTLRAQLFYLGEFVAAHSARVLRGEADVAPLIEINTMVQRGLRGERAAA